MALEMGEAGAGVPLTWPAKAEDWATAQQAAQANPTVGSHIPQGVLFLHPHCRQPPKEGGNRVVLI